MYKNILEQIGNTPMVRINNFGLNKKIEIFAKLEGANPGGSIKDRIALKMIREAVKNGELTKKKTIIEPTSGNTGIGLAMIGTVLGYSVEIVMSSAVSVERQKMIKAYGAKIILTDPKKGTDGAILKAREMVKKNPQKYFMPDQFSNKNNKLAHYGATAKEIWQDMNGKIDYFVSSIGTSGTIMGVGEYLKKMNPKIKIVCAYPHKGHYIQGLKNMEEAIVPKLYDEKKIDEFVTVESEKAFAMARQLARREGIFAGMSSGAVMLATLEIAKKIKNGRIVMIFPDRGEKYLSTKLFG
ncbi:MAG: cysteine synthase B [Candidatus Moranbacteria bacterium RIFOXYA12_FULL_35_19]|nr:MAG: cysteine synthase B [Candidatus Moranbacteria bacterium RIFOXYB12_FULL_35_8]OGI33267.1 MAG: cysteine synthase B [Candidatus Moranbacteria bacterium RIFOXYC12_FULL_36_13]OGI36461.1 MAG: cysteine synthase B [Candidatus Moranbacteria bacterium RIFOXYA12_FULL_35_19]